MATYLVSDTDLTSVANAIRTKGGTSAQLAFPNGFVTAVEDITAPNRDWSEIGYSAEPEFIQAGFNYAKQVAAEYTDSKTYYNNKQLIFMPMVDTSNRTNMVNMFGNCLALSNIPLLDTSLVTNMNSMFFGCSSLFSIPLLDTSSVTNMGYMFYRCLVLSSIPLLDTSSVTHMDAMFNNCSALSSIPLLDTSSAQYMSSMFGDCSALSSIPLLDTSSVTNAANMFANCPNLSDESINNILAMCANATSYTGTKTLTALGLSATQKSKCQTLSNWQAFVDAGWTA